MRLPMPSLIVRSSIVLSAVVVVVAAALSDDASLGAMGWLVAAVAVACAVTAALYPDGQAATATLVALGLNWLLVVEDELSVLTALAGACGVLLHSAAAIEAITPYGGRLAPGTYRLWAWRTGLVVASVFALWGVAAGADRIEHSSGTVVLIALGTLLGGGVWLVRARVLDAQPTR